MISVDWWITERAAARLTRAWRLVCLDPQKFGFDTAPQIKDILDRATGMALDEIESIAADTGVAADLQKKDREFR